MKQRSLINGIIAALITFAILMPRGEDNSPSGKASSYVERAKNSTKVLLVAAEPEGNRLFLQFQFWNGASRYELVFFTINASHPFFKEAQAGVGAECELGYSLMSVDTATEKEAVGSYIIIRARAAPGTVRVLSRAQPKPQTKPSASSFSFTYF